MIKIDLTKGLSDNAQYKAFKFPGGEIHVKFKDAFVNMANTLAVSPNESFQIVTRLNTSDDILFLVIAVDTLKKDWPTINVEVVIPYMPYQQADRDFSVGESFSLVSIVRILCSIPVDKYTLYDPHSDQSAGFFRFGDKKVEVIDNSAYIQQVILKLNDPNLILLSPDAGAYKKIFKLADKIQFKGEVASANKSRSISSGNIDSIELSRQDFEGRNVLIVDDICVGGRTFVELAKKLKQRNVGLLSLAVSHGIFSNGFSELEEQFHSIFTTNSRKDDYGIDFELSDKFLNVIPII